MISNADTINNITYMNILKYQDTRLKKKKKKKKYLSSVPLHEVEFLVLSFLDNISLFLPLSFVLFYLSTVFSPLLVDELQKPSTFPVEKKKFLSKKK